MVQTLETQPCAANNEIVKKTLLKAGRDVAEGSATWQSMRTIGVFPPLVIQMVASRKQTGELSSMPDYVCVIMGGTPTRE